MIAGASRARAGFAAGAAVGTALIALAFAVAPRACAGGLEAYLGAGVVAVLALGALPFVARVGRSTARRIAWSLAFVVLGVATWLAGLIVANVRFICGLGYL